MAEQYIRPNNIDDLNDVDITNPQNQDLLVYNTSTGEWENGTSAAVDDHKVLADSGDSTPGFLDAKVDGATIVVNASDKLEVTVDSDDIDNESDVTGTTVTDALNELSTHPIVHVDATSGAVSITQLDRVYFIQAAATATTVTIPEAVSANEGHILGIFKESGAGIVYVKTLGGQTIAGDLVQTAIINSDEGIHIASDDSTDWLLLADERKYVPITIETTFDYLATDSWICDVLEITTTSGDKTATLPASTATWYEGREIFIRNIGSGEITVVPNGADFNQIVIPQGGQLVLKVVNGFVILFDKSFYDSDDIINESGVTGTTVTAALDNNYSYIGAVETLAEDAQSDATLALDASAANTYKFTKMKAPNGVTPTFYSNTSMSFVDGTRTFSVIPTGQQLYYQVGTEYELNSTKTLVISATEGLHFIYFDGLTLSETTTFTTTLITEKVLLSIIYWDATNSQEIYFADERHGISMSGATHLAWHTRLGTSFQSGLALGDIEADETGADDVDAQCSYAAGIISDEDLYFSIAADALPAAMPVFYKTGASGLWRSDTATNFPCKRFSTSRLAYNEWTGAIWQQTEVTNGDFVLSHIFATNDSARPMIVIQGEVEYSNLNNARDGAMDEISDIHTAGLPFAEFLAVGTVIFQTRDSYSNSVKARIRSDDNGNNWLDFRTSDLSPAKGPISHSDLSGLQGGAAGELYHLTEDEYDNLYDTDSYIKSKRGATGALSAAALESTYQAALLLTPGGNALSATNKATVIVDPGPYNITGSFEMTSPYVDVVCPTGRAVFVSGEAIVPSGATLSGFTVSNGNTSEISGKITNCNMDLVWLSSGSTLEHCIIEATGAGDDAITIISDTIPPDIRRCVVIAGTGNTIIAESGTKTITLSHSNLNKIYDGSITNEF